MLLNTLDTSANVAVIGASGGIGSALAAELSQTETVAAVNTFSRDPEMPETGLYFRYAMDLDDEESIADASSAAAANGPIDLVIVATGMLHNGVVQPEKSMSQLDADAMLKVLAVNTVGPALVAKHFLPKMQRNGKSVFAVLSARVGSISDNHLGGWTSYRASKSALNMVIRTLAHEHRHRFPQSIVVGLHPGTVDTALSRPFKKRVPKTQLFTPEQAAQQLLAVINALTPENSGLFFAWDGRPIEF